MQSLVLLKMNVDQTLIQVKELMLYSQYIIHNTALIPTVSPLILK